MAKKSKTSTSFPGEPSPVESPISRVVNPDAPSTDTTQTADHDQRTDASQSAGEESSGVDPRERIAARAYERYLQRGGAHGRETEDWLEAERELSGPPGAGSGSTGER